MARKTPSPDVRLADVPGDAAVSAPELLGKGFREYLRYRFTLKGEHAKAGERTHDMLRFGRVVAVLPVDPIRDEVVVIRQFRLPAQVATGRGELIEIVAGHVEPGEELAQAARRECAEEIGVAPSAVLELFTYMPTPGASDEQITLFLGIVDASAVPQHAGAAAENEETRPMRVPIDAALAARDRGTLQNGLLILALHWLALNRGRIDEMTRLRPRG
jgi:ADP-ribose diphosphatase